ncbi:Wzz/FepE/Etk N-terminal domain-containing protein [Parvicella tangerina]|uniref:Polysaccharide chain length determinant N-terminal domain-containing protein n=1 Tax=Parvicella tangerina TaxID=2829795 RepID=A0A916JIF9_9FLAO|nr:Wzz/FepE/Etk N-terminal domain-containing protein [Parvicella tangerina]CAG5076361.1 hypothetical protein CRYO30217_00084 [Parvicella tangerina]
MEENKINKKALSELYQNRWKIVFTTLFFGVLALVVYFITPKKYAASAIVYPTSSNSIDEVVSNPTFGFEVQADRTIQLFESQMMKDQLVKEFNLIEYYSLDTTSKDWFSKLTKYYARDISFSRTKYQSVVVRVTLTDPFLAADIANASIAYLDTIQKNMFVGNLTKIKAEIKSKIEVQQQELDNLLISIISFDSSSSAENPISSNKINQLNFKNQTGQTQSGDAVIMKALKSNPGFLLEKQVNDYYIKLNALNSLKGKYEEVKETIELPFPGVYVVSKAKPDETPTSPKLFWNLTFGLLIGAFVSIGFILLRLSIKSVLSDLRTN